MNKPKHGFWRIHLSTAILALLLTASFMALNFTLRREANIGFPGVGDDGYILLAFEYGFPWKAVYVPNRWVIWQTEQPANPSIVDLQFMVNFDESTTTNSVHDQPDEYEDGIITKVRWKRKNLILDVLAYLVSIAFLTSTSEYFIRRKKRTDVVTAHL